MQVNVIIPTYKPEKSFYELMKRLKEQTMCANRIIIMNTEEKYFEPLLYETDFSRAFPNAEVRHLSQREFDHGGTRNKAASRCDGDVFICMTQDALPADSHLIEKLVEALYSDEKIAVAYARQLAGKNSGEIEKFTRTFNYPPESSVKGKEQLGTLGIKTFFCSNVCAAYKREIFQELGGFTKHTIFNEDMIFAAGAVKAGYRIAYAAEALVYHSHDYTCRQQFHRNFDNGVSQADHPEIFAAVSSEAEGMHLVKQTVAHLLKIKRPLLIVKFGADCVAKYAGFFLGKRYQKLPQKWVVKCSMNKHYWK